MVLATAQDGTWTGNPESFYGALRYTRFYALVKRLLVAFPLVENSSSKTVRETGYVLDIKEIAREHNEQKEREGKRSTNVFRFVARDKMLVLNPLQIHVRPIIYIYIYISG